MRPEMSLRHTLKLGLLLSYYVRLLISYCLSISVVSLMSFNEISLLFQVWLDE